MQKLSLYKIFIAILGIILLCHLKSILQVFQYVFKWLSESMAGMGNFDEGAQAAIAFFSIVLVLVMAYRILHDRYSQ